MNEVVRMAHTNSGMRCIVIPGVRMFRMVTRKFIEPRIDDVPRMITATSHRLWPNGPRSDSGGEEGQPASAAPPVKKTPSITVPPGGSIHNAKAVIFGKAQPPAP